MSQFFSLKNHELTPAKENGNDDIADLLGRLAQIRRGIEGDKDFSPPKATSQKKKEIHHNPLCSLPLCDLIPKTREERNFFEQESNGAETMADDVSYERYYRTDCEHVVFQPKKQSDSGLSYFFNDPHLQKESSAIDYRITDYRSTLPGQAATCGFDKTPYIAGHENLEKGIDRLETILEVPIELSTTLELKTPSTSPPAEPLTPVQTPVQTSTQPPTQASEQSTAPQKADQESNEAIVIPFQEIRKKRNDMRKKSRCRHLSTTQRERSHSRAHMGGFSQENGTPIRITSHKIWPPACRSENESTFNASDILGRVFLIAGWGGITCGLLLFAKSYFIRPAVWAEYCFPALLLGLLFLIAGIVTEFIYSNRFKIPEAKLAKPDNERRFIKAEAMSSGRQVPAHPGSGTTSRSRQKSGAQSINSRHKIAIPKNIQKNNDGITHGSLTFEEKTLQSTYLRLLELRDEIDILIERADVSSP